MFPATAHSHFHVQAQVTKQVVSKSATEASSVAPSSTPFVVAGSRLPRFLHLSRPRRAFSFWNLVFVLAGAVATEVALSLR